MRILFSICLFIAFSSASAQDWWSKTKSEAIPADLSSTTLIVEKFKTEKLDSAPKQAYLAGKSGDHPHIKKTNDELSEYNREMRRIFKNYKHKYILASKTKAKDTEYYGTDTCKYVLKHDVYLRKYMKGGALTHFYTYIFYFQNRATGESYPYIYLFDEKRLKSLEELVGYLNEL